MDGVAPQADWFRDAEQYGRKDSSLTTRITNIVRSMISWLCATMLVCGCIAAFYFFQRADEELRRHVENSFAQTYADHDVSVGSAHFVKGEGIRLRKVSIVKPSTQQHPNRTELAYCDEAVLFCAPTMEQLLQGVVDIDRVRLRGLSLHPTRYQNGRWNIEELVPPNGCDRKMPTIVLEDAKVEVVDRMSPQPKVMTFGKH